ncbi:MAG: ABC transporter, partial [Proteobacteria bacterium]|nr:ABC transporter [Pseudomonadota bacterium]
LATREALAVALNEFEGTLMLVSHDRALLRSVCDEFWLVARGGVAPFDGDLQDYQRHLIEEARRAREPDAARRAREASSTTNAIVSIADSDDSTRTSSINDAETPRNPAEQRRLDAQRRQQLADRARPLKRALQQAEARMHALGDERAALQARLATPLPPADIAEAGRRLKALGDELAALEDSWLDLTTQIESIGQSPAPD